MVRNFYLVALCGLVVGDLVAANGHIKGRDEELDQHYRDINCSVSFPFILSSRYLEPGSALVPSELIFLCICFRTTASLIAVPRAQAAS
jgi:hypothetical protein